MFSLDDKQRRELWGLGLFALALLLALSLIPLAAFGEGAARVFPAGNIVGVAGEALRGGLTGFMGVGAVALPILAALWGVFCFRKVDPSIALRWTLLFAGLVVLVPSAISILGGTAGDPTPAAGWLGAATGLLLVSALSAVGGAIVLFFLFAALSVATVGWNPLRTAFYGGRFAMNHARQAAVALPRPAIALPSPLKLLPRRGGAAPVANPLPAIPRADDPGVEDAEFEFEADGDWDDDVQPAIDPDATQLDPPVAPAVPPAPTASAPVPAAAPAARPEKANGKAAKPAGPRGIVAEQVELLPEDSGDPYSTDLPTPGLLVAAPPRDEARGRQELDKLGQVLIDKLATFKIEGEIVGMTTGPVVTQFEVSPAPGIKVARIANLEADLALALRAPSVRIVAPIPGKGAVGVEVPNPEPQMVYFRETIESPAFRSTKAALPLALGKDIAGRSTVVDLAKMPHLLIAGATGSGKSVCVNTIITSLIFRHTPRTLRFLMVDPKMVELSMYNDLPHLRHPVVTDNNDAAAVLKWAVLEMERRYTLLSVNGVRNLQDFNKKIEQGSILRSAEADGEEGDPDRWLYKGGELPYIVVIIDELADLMMTVQGDVEKPLALLAQKARAIGIHLILATQRPSVNVITGLIKANFPSRIAFRVSSKVDSRTILDQNGADALLGNGDMLMLPPASSEPVRLQGAYLSTEETEAMMGWYREQARLRREEALAAGLDPAESTRAEANILDEVRAQEDSGELESDEEPGERDKLFRQAAELCIQHQGGSTSLLQRRLRIGYGRAARIIDQLHFAGVLGPPDGSKPREVQIDFTQLDSICGAD
ncbi:DNA translocase FtsK [Longimicrobium sp.]|uniref:FtsK/SpoIIIE family DNA translocase n=1 Tax=Longimicrobium sp. TaxID=2029185 RepID=UPI002E345A52|nr:DNA translocase FtsK [Longimicrobium sp.]HEX6038627.1 DNA translocase FtsK [Longimicrobium sp.]